MTNYFKRFKAVLLAAALAAVFSACGNNDAGGSNYDPVEPPNLEQIFEAIEAELELFIEEIEAMAEPVEAAIDYTDDPRTLEHFIQAIESKFDGDKDTPFFSMIGAVNGVMWHDMAGVPKVAVYEFESIDALEQAFERSPFMEEQGWIKNGRFLLETRSLEVRDFFISIE